VEDERQPCAACGALNTPTAAFCWQCQSSLRVLVGAGASQRPGRPMGFGAATATTRDGRPPSATGTHASPVRWAVALIAVLGLAAGAWVLTRPHIVSLPLELDGARRVSYDERSEASPFDSHPPAHVMAGSYGSDPPAAAGSFGVVIWVIEEGHPNGPGPIQILTAAKPAGLTFDDMRQVSENVGNASFECVPATSIERTICAWNDGQVDGMIGTPELDLHAALLQTERIAKQIST